MMRRLLLLAALVLAPIAAGAQEERVHALMAAARGGDTASLQKLLDSGVDANATDSHGFNALVPAIRSGNAEAVRLLLERGANPNIRSRVVGLTPLMAAAAHGDLLAIEALLARGAQLNARADDGSTALGFAEMKGRHEAVRYLERRGALK